MENAAAETFECVVMQCPIQTPFFRMLRHKIAALAAAVVIYGAYNLSFPTIHTEPVLGTIVDVQHSYNELMQAIEARVTVEYTLNDTLHTTSLRTTTYSVPFKDDTIRLLADASDPLNVIEEPEISPELVAWLYIVIGLLVLLALVA